MESSAYEAAYSAFLESASYDQGESALHALLWAAFQAGWKAGQAEVQSSDPA